MQGEISDVLKFAAYKNPLNNFAIFAKIVEGRGSSMFIVFF